MKGGNKEVTNKEVTNEVTKRLLMGNPKQRQSPENEGELFLDNTSLTSNGAFVKFNNRKPSHEDAA